jgi:endonuclease/exonuclease/phosphatase family metal-dependent hydrolase
MSPIYVWARAAMLLSLIAIFTLAGCGGVPKPPMPAAMEGPVPVRVLCINILNGGEELGQPLSKTLDIITETGADIVLLQEQEGAATKLARQLGFDVHVVSSSVAVLSRWPMAQTGRHGAAVAYQPGRLVHVFGVHLEAYPYGPYDLRDAPTLTTTQLIETAEATRGHQIAPVLAEMAPHIAAGAPVILGGDFNEPSHLDWVEAAAPRHFGRTLPWPTSRRVAGAGLTDSYRAIYTCPAEYPGDTWTPLQAPGEVHDRIDRLYHAGAGVLVLFAEVVGESSEFADRVFSPYPTDHRGVLVEYTLPPAVD